MVGTVRRSPGLERSAIRLAWFTALLAVAACATAPEPPVAAPRAGCPDDKPLAERQAYVETWLTRAFAAAPPLSRDEYKAMSDLAACHGAGVGGCGTGWEDAARDGLYERYMLRSGAYIIPDRMSEAAAQSDRSLKIRDLLVAQSTVWQTREHFAEQRERGRLSQADWQEASTALFIAEGAIEDAIVCEASRP